MWNVCCVFFDGFLIFQASPRHWCAAQWWGDATVTEQILSFLWTAKNLIAGYDNYPPVSASGIDVISPDLLKKILHGGSPCAAGRNDCRLASDYMRQVADSVWSLQNSPGGTRHHADDGTLRIPAPLRRGFLLCGCTSRWISSEMHPYVVTYARMDILPAHSCC